MPSTKPQPIARIAAVKITFKDEDEVNGCTVGPCKVWLNQPDRHGNDFKDLGWITRDQALEVAHRFGLILKES